MTEAIFGLLGVMVGAFLTGAFELWRRALEGQAAARLIRIETIENRVNVERALTHGHRGERVSRDAWNDYRIAVAPFLEELHIMKIAESYGLVDKINERWLGALKTGGRSPLRPWVDRVREDGRLLRAVEAENPISLAFRLLRGRKSVGQDEIAEAYGVTKDEIEAIRRDLEKDLE